MHDLMPNHRRAASDPEIQAQLMPDRLRRQELGDERLELFCNSNGLTHASH